MSGRSAALLSAVAMILPLIASTNLAQAEWLENGTPICEEPGNQLSIDMIESSDGGAFITWNDGRTGELDIYAQRVDAWGRPMWTAGGVQVCGADSAQHTPTITTDQSGGVIITWYDKRNGTYDIYAQRIDPEGLPLWTADGVAVAVMTGTQSNPTIASDNAGGAFIAWDDYRGGTYADIYAQRLNEYGVVEWTANGIVVTNDSYDQIQTIIVPDGFGGAILAWHDYRNEITVPDVYAQRLSSSGGAVWTSGGVDVCTQPGTQFVGPLVADGDGGAIVAWDDFRGSDLDIYAQYVSSAGTPQWTTDGAPVSVTSGSQRHPDAVLCPEGVMIAWRDDRTSPYEIYAQKLSMGGSAQWTTNGILVSVGSADRQAIRMVEDMQGGAILAWMGDQLGTYDVYAQRITGEGDFPWTPEDLPLGVAAGTQSLHEIVSDGEGGAIVVWGDNRGADYDVYVQRVTRQGYWGLPAPAISSVADVPSDQGGQVWIEFEASRLDSWLDPSVDYYSVWRNIPPAAMQMQIGDAVTLADPAGASADLVGSAYFMGPTTAWQLIGTVDAHYLVEYGFLAETARDSISTDPATEQYFVSAHSVSGVDWWDSYPVEGHSVDNLAPYMPAPVTAEYTGGTDLWIHWGPNTEADLHHYAVYRGDSPDFVPDEATRLGTVTDTSFVDGGYGYGSEHYYKISAWDVHENESPFALITPDMIAGAPGAGPPRANALFQNAPNPMAASTHIAFSLESQGHVVLAIFDFSGRLVRTLVNETRGPSRYVESWDGRDDSGRRVPSGAYFYRLSAPGWSEVKKLTVAR